MRLALLQSTLHVRSRAANVQGLMAMFRTAVERVPAPEVVVLPAQCDSGGAALSRTLPEACLTMVRETLAALAREWGVYCIAGLHIRRGTHWHSEMVLLDADGDLGAASGEPSTVDGLGGGGACCVTGMGEIVLAVPDEPPADAAVTTYAATAPGTPASPRLIVASYSAAASPARRRRFADWRGAIGPAASGVYRAIIVAAGDGANDGGGLHTAVWRPDGTALAMAEDFGQVALYVELS